MPVDIEVGIHAHNNQQLAFANTIEGIIRRRQLSGRDHPLRLRSRRGNCRLELLIGFLKNPKFNIVPILDAIGKSIIPLRKK